MKYNGWVETGGDGVGVGAEASRRWGHLSWLWKDRKTCSTKKIIERSRGGKFCVWTTEGAAWLGKEKRGRFLELADGGGRKPRQR